MTPKEMADRVSALMHQKLGVRGRDLSAKLRHARGLMPAYLRAEAQIIADAARSSRDPRLRTRVEPGRVAHAYSQCVTWLSAIDEKERRRTRLVNWAGGLAFQLLLLIVAVIAVLVWRGFV